MLPGLTISNLLRLLGAGGLIWVLTVTEKDIAFIAVLFVIYLEGAVRKLAEPKGRIKALEEWARAHSQWATRQSRAPAE